MVENESITNYHRKNMYHYTSVNGLYGILGNKEIWMTHSGFLNDPTEIAHFDKLLKKILTRFKLKPNYKEFEKIIFDPIYSGNYEHYITSFSSDPDSLSLWNNYGKDDGYNLAFKKSTLKEEVSDYFFSLNDSFTFNIRKVIYEDELKEKAILDELEACYLKWDSMDKSDRRQSMDFFRLIQYSFIGYRICFKDKGYAPENEVRLIISLNSQVSKNHRQYRLNKGALIPYLKVPLIKDTLGISSIKVGPRVSADFAAEGLKKFCNDKNLKIKIDKSKIPIRY
jgi:hypothetical protein